MEAEVVRTGDFTSEVTHWIAGRIAAAQEGGGVFRLSLCGGSTPRGVYAALAQRSEIDWERVMLTFGDERAVPPDDESSNYRMVRESLLDPAGVPGANVLRLCGELDPAVAAERAEAHLRKLAGIAGEPCFVHDLILLGMGEDGHTASLFPGTAALDEEDRWVVANHVPQLDSWRITFTYPLIAAAREAAFLVNGAAKHAVAGRVLQGDPAYPSSAVRAGRIRWFLGE